MEMTCLFEATRTPFCLAEPQSATIIDLCSLLLPFAGCWPAVCDADAGADAALRCWLLAMVCPLIPRDNRRKRIGRSHNQAEPHDLW